MENGTGCQKLKLLHGSKHVKKYKKNMCSLVVSAIFSTVLKRIWKNVPMIVFKKCQYLVGKNVEVLISIKMKKK